MKVFTELTPECDVTAQMYAVGFEKKEIASKKCRALSTINNQIETAMRILGVRNGRELAIKLAERICGFKVTLEISQVMRASIACMLLVLLLLDNQLEMQRQRTRTRTNSRIETVSSMRTRVRGKGIQL